MVPYRFYLHDNDTGADWSERIVLNADEAVDLFQVYKDNNVFVSKIANDDTKEILFQENLF